MPLHLHVSLHPRRLLEAAADTFLAAVPATPSQPFPTPPCLLVLRQGGLRDDLLSLAAARGVPGWFDPPICLFADVHEWFGSSALRPVDDYERVVLIERALRETAGPVFGRVGRPAAYIDALDRLFGELIGEGASASQFEAALESRERDAFEQMRDTELAAIFRRYCALLAGAERRDGRDRLHDCARTIAADPAALAARLGGRREVRIVGLQDLKGGWPALLRALLASSALDRVHIYTSSHLDLPADLQPDTTHIDEVDRPLAAALFCVDAAGPVRTDITVHAFAAPDPDREVEHVAVCVRALIDAGTPPHRIAVVARQARPSMDLVVEALERIGVPATARRRHAFAGIPVVRALLTILNVAAEGWSRHGLVELAEQPYLDAHRERGHRLDPLVIDHIGFRRRVLGLDAWRAALEQLLEEAAAVEARRAAGEPEEGFRRDPPPSERVRRAIEGFEGFLELARPLDEPRTLAGWLAWVESFLDQDPWHVGRAIYRAREHLHVVRLDTRAWEWVRRIIGAWHSALDTWGGETETLDVRAFERRLREILSGDAAVWTATRRGVHVLEGLAAAHRAFDHVFLVGLSGDRVPVRMPRSPLLDEYDRDSLAAAGLPLERAATWDARERELFRLLVASAEQSLTVSWATLDGNGADVARSAFIDEVLERTGTEAVELPLAHVLTPGMPIVTGDDAIETALHGARIEVVRATGALSPWNGAIEDPDLRARIAERLGEDYRWSATQLEKFALCPWAWFSERLLRLEKLEDPELEIDARTRGTVYHDALRRFFEAAAGRSGKPVFLRTEDLDWALPILRTSFTEALRSAGGVWLGHPSLREAQERELLSTLEAYVQAEIGDNESSFMPRRKRHKLLRTGVLHHELTFEDAVLERHGVRARFRGMIDRVEAGVDERVDAGHCVAAIDYKSSKWSTPAGGKSQGWDDDVVLQVPIYAHALTQLLPGATVARAGYRAVRSGEAVHELNLARVRDRRLETSAEDVQRYEAALDAAARHVGRARAGGFPAGVPDSCNCPPWCHGWDVCRVKGGPKTGDWP